VKAVLRPDADDGLQELFDLWSASTADALHRVLVLHPPVRSSFDALQPLALLHKHHETEPESSPTTALLVLTDRRWGNGSWRLVRQIADSEILGAGQLDLLAGAFLAASDAVYWRVPDEWFAGGAGIVIDLDGHGAHDLGHEAGGRGPIVARRDVFPPLRRWAAAHQVAREPAAWAALLARAGELNARHAGAVVAGLLDRIDVLTPRVQSVLINEAVTCPHRTVRRLALELIAARDGADAARHLAQCDPCARIRAWAATLVGSSPTDQAVEETPARELELAEQPALF
jgi:hypothetical protein